MGYALLLIAVVAAAALWLRHRSSLDAAVAPRADDRPPREDRPNDDAGRDAQDDADENDDETYGASDFGDDEHATAAMTTDGVTFIGEPHGVSLLQPADPDQPNAPRSAPAEFLRAGDFSAGRVVRGAPDHDPWRLELLAREGEYVRFGFMTEEAACSALALLEERRVLQYVEGDDGQPVRPSAEQYAEARHRYEETERELAMLMDTEEPGEHNGHEPIR